MKRSVRLPLFELVAQDIADVDVKLLHALSLGDLMILVLFLDRCGANPMVGAVPTKPIYWTKYAQVVQAYRRSPVNAELTWRALH